MATPIKMNVCMKFFRRSRGQLNVPYVPSIQLMCPTRFTCDHNLQFSNPLSTKQLIELLSTTLTNEVAVKQLSVVERLRQHITSYSFEILQ